MEEAWNRYDLKQNDSVGARVGCEPAYEKIYWIRENVLKPIWRELFFRLNMEYEMLSNKQTDDFYDAVMKGEYDKHFNFASLKAKITRYGKTKNQIADEIRTFCDAKQFNFKDDFPNFYAYYADYDWVVFCQIFGKMIDLPKGFPMYCRDLKQNLDDKMNLKSNKRIADLEYSFMNDESIVMISQERYSLEERLRIIKNHPNYPKQENEHNALDDARWNKKLHEFLNNL